MPFCHSPWTNIDISPTGVMSPCCKFQMRYYDTKHSLDNATIKDYRNSDFLNAIKQEFLNDQWPKGCERCKIEETNNIHSKRMLDQTRWEHHYNKYDLSKHDFITASLAFGNTCNLSCITCGPHSSSRWRQEYKDIYNIDIPHHGFYKHDFTDDFVSCAPDIVHIDIPGGEPFLSGTKEQKQLLQSYIDRGRADQITLHYTTNATLFPDQEWWSLWEHFKEVEIQLSVDGLAEKYEYIRFPAEWNVTLENINLYLSKEKTMHNFKLSVSHTVSAYNIFYLDEFFDWSQRIGLPRPWCGRVHTPSFMRPEVWPEPARTFVHDKLMLSSHQECRVWANYMINNDHSCDFDTFKLRTKQHDSYRGLNFAETFVEMAEWIQ
jgi:hypothetical protein